jgi:hypothetical protein
MLVLEIALGIILAYILLKAGPLLLAAAFVALPRVFANLQQAVTTPLRFPPFWRNAATKRRGPNPMWLTAIIVGTGAVTCGVLSVLAFLSAYLGA